MSIFEERLARGIQEMGDFAKNLEKVKTTMADLDKEKIKLLEKIGSKFNSPKGLIDLFKNDPDGILKEFKTLITTQKRYVNLVRIKTEKLLDGIAELLGVAPNETNALAISDILHYKVRFVKRVRRLYNQLVYSLENQEEELKISGFKMPFLKIPVAKNVVEYNFTKNITLLKEAISFEIQSRAEISKEYTKYGDMILKLITELPDVGSNYVQKYRRVAQDGLSGSQIAMVGATAWQVNTTSMNLTIR